MRKHYRELDILRGLAVAMVIFGHSIIVSPINLNKIEPYGFFHRFLSSTHMPLFFLLSGFCFGFSNWKDYLTKKTKRIVIPFFVFEALWLAASLLMNQYVNGTDDPKELLIAMITGVNYWFLYTLMIIFLVFPFISKLFKNMLLGIAAIIVIGALSLLGFIPKTCNLQNAVTYLFYFSIGYYLKLRFNEDKQRSIALVKKSCNLPLWLISLALWIFLMYRKYFGLSLLPSGFDNIHRKLIAIIGIVNVGTFAMLIRNLRISKLFEEAGKYSLQLYLFNGFLLVPSRVLAINVLHITSPIAIIAIIFTITFFVSLLIIRFIVKPVKLFRVLCGMV